MGVAPELPTMIQLNGLALSESEGLLWRGAGKEAFFYVFAGRLRGGLAPLWARPSPRTCLA